MAEPIDAPEYKAIAAASEKLSRKAPKNLPGVSEEDPTGEVRELYQHFKRHFGRPDVPAILQCFATHPPLLKHMMALSEELIFSEGRLGRRAKEMIATLISSRNNCPYCADSHGFFLRMHGGSAGALASLLDADYEDESITARERALLRFAEKVDERSSSVRPEDIGAMRLAGWSDPQIAEAIHVTALFATYNRVANAFGLESQGLLSLYDSLDPYREQVDRKRDE